MGCNFSCCKRDNHLNDIKDPLQRRFHCFVCDEWFETNYEYNKHIPTCNMNIHH